MQKIEMSNFLPIIPIFWPMFSPNFPFSLKCSSVFLGFSVQ